MSFRSIHFGVIASVRIHMFNGKEKNAVAAFFLFTKHNLANANTYLEEQNKKQEAKSKNKRQKILYNCVLCV